MNWKFTPDRPGYQQVMQLLRGQLLRNELPPGSRVPSVRELAAHAQVNPNTVQRAMNELEREGLLVGGGTNGRTVTEDQDILEQVRADVMKSLAWECAERFMVFGVSPKEAAAMLLALEGEQEEI